MATGQGAAGVRIKLRDLSEVQIVNEPIVTAGVVGFSSKGPLNKIIGLSSTASMDSVLGSGYNNPKFNQGLYASRGILNARGNVEFVRPYGEAIVTDTSATNFDTNQELKSDAFVVKYDFASGATDSLEISHYAATRYKTDGMANDFPGSSRQIYRISDALVENTNVHFELNTDATGDVVPLFAIINDDPTAAIRAEDDSAVDPTSTGNDYISIKTAASNSASKCQQDLTIAHIPTGGDNFSVLRMDGSKVTIEMIAPGGTQTIATATTVAVPTQACGAVIVTDAGALPTPIIGSINVPNISYFSLNDRVMFSIGTGTSTLPTGIVADTFYKVSAIAGNAITVQTDAGVAITIADEGTAPFYITNMTETLRRLATTFKSVTFGLTTEVKSSSPGNSKTLTVIAVRGPRIPTAFTSFYITDFTAAWLVPGTLNVLDTTVSVLIESSIGRTFVSLGLAIESYIDINYDTVLEKAYTLTADGAALAALYMDVSYMFAGTLYNFVGTIVPYVLNQQNMYIVDQAQNVQNGFQFIINEHPALSEAAASTSFNFSETISNGMVSSYTTQTSYMLEDPAITNAAIWSYDPRNNNTSAILGSAWNLFLKKDQTNSDMLVSAGTAISNLFARGYEAIDYNVMETILTICELRKDCFSIFDGVDENRIDKALNKMVGIGTEGNDVGRWGAIFDGRSFMYDTVYTKLTVEVVKSIEVAQIIAFNRASGVYWLAPAGFQSGRIPSSMASRQKYIRSYGYGADDPNSDIAKLYDANINPTRVTQAGAFIFGQKTMLRRNTALNRLNVIMLIAGIHRRFATYLDDKTFQLNTAQLRNNIQSELQAQIDAIKTANPAGLTAGRVVCDGTNNTPDIIDTNQLIVDVIIQPTRTAEFITLRTTVQRTGADLTTNTAIIGG